MSNKFVDFAAIKAAVNIDQAAHMLGLRVVVRGDQARGPCPACNQGGDRALSLNSAKRSFYCFAAKDGGDGGDVIKLVAHIRGIGQREAAEELQDHFGVGAQRQPTRAAGPAPKAEAGSRSKPAFEKQLVHEHEKVQAGGLSPATAEELGIGVAIAGWGKGNVLIPVRNEHGELLGFAAGDFTFHKSVESNVVAFRKAV